MPKRTDKNQAEIIAGLRELGASIQDLHTVGHGCPDILVAYRWQLYLMEIKSVDGRMTPAEIVWRDNWRGSYYIVHTLEEAIEIITNGDE